MIPDKDMRTTIRVYRKGGCVKVCTVLQKINNKIKGEREEKKKICERIHYLLTCLCSSSFQCINLFFCCIRDQLLPVLLI